MIPCISQYALHKVHLLYQMRNIFGVVAINTIYEADDLASQFVSQVSLGQF